MERLGHIIDEAARNKQWEPIQLSRGGPLLTHLFYANDLIIFAQASVTQAHVILRCLDCFCTAAGQSINKDKSAVFCSKNTDRQSRLDIAASLGIPITNNLGTYLGVPILHERTTTETYQGILNKIDKKLAGWKIKTLSLAGHVTLAKSVLGALPAYAMQTSVIPATTCEAIDKKIRDFVWGSSDESRKIHLVNWNQICAPKSQGGLGLRLAAQLNRAYMTKLAFLFFSQPEALWVRVLQSKYFRETREGLIQKKPSSKSAIWRGITRDWPTMLRGARPLIHDGQNTAFWTTSWVDSGVRLIDFADTEAVDFDIEESVADMIDDQGSWNFPKLRNIISDEDLNMVAGMPPPSMDQGEDDWCWGLEANGKFSISSAYDLLRENHSPAEEFWDRIWRWQGPTRINHFLWLAMQDKLLTNSQRVRRRIASDARCCYCHAGIEDVTHILRDCPFAARV
ncbi:Putative ribonuclease H protein At1g65750 [Linum perenne]